MLLIAMARTLLQNQPSDPLKDKTSLDLMGQLAKAKETRVRAIMDDVNSLASTALAKKASSAAPVPCAWTAIKK